MGTTILLTLLASVFLFNILLRISRNAGASALMVIALLGAYGLGYAAHPEPPPPPPPPVVSPPPTPAPIPTIAAAAFSERLSALDLPGSARVNSSIPGSMVIKNTSPVAWNINVPPLFTVGYRWYRNGRFMSESRSPLQQGFQPGEQRRVSLQILTPPTSGHYVIRVDLLFEGVGWFEPHGNKPLQKAIDIL
jgi:hypothetical protein